MSVQFRIQSQPIFRHFTKQEGVPENAVVNKIIQDKQGIMWFATTDGLFKFDSRVFTPYLHESGNPRSINGSYVWDIICDKVGDLWFATNGLVRYNRNNDSFTNFTHDPNNKNSLSSNRILCMMEDSRSGIWVGTDKGVDYLSVEGSKVNILHYPLTDKHGGLRKVRCIVEGADGTLWIGTDSGLVRMKKDGSVKAVFENEQADRFPAANIVDAIYADKKNGIWLGFRSGGLYHFDTVAEKLVPVQSFKTKNEPNPHVWSIVADGLNRLWIATTSGLARLDLSSQHWQWYTNEYGNANSLKNDGLFSLCIDRQGGIWTGSYGAGVDYFYPESAKIHTLRFSGELPGSRPFDAYVIGRQKGKDLWAVQGGGNKVVFFKPPGITRTTLSIPLSPPGAYSAFYLDSNGIMWIGGISYLARFDLARGKIDYYPIRVGTKKHLPRARIITIYEDSKKRLWVGGSFGFMLFDRKLASFQEIFTINGKSLFGGEVNSITEDSKQNLWVGGYGKLRVFKNGSRGFEQIQIDPLPDPSVSPNIFSIKEDASGRIWLGTGPTGLQLYDPVRNRVSQYHNDRKIPLDHAYFIQIDNQGDIWTNGYYGGLIRYHPEDQTIQHFDQKDGLPSDLLTSESNFQDNDGTMYFGTPKGTFYFNPKEIKVNRHEQPIVFSSLKLFNKPVQAKDETGILSHSLYTAREIVFRHDQNVFTLDFATLNYIRSDKNRYAYMLEGFEKQWNYVSVPSATYTNLSPGKYTFLVKAANNDGYWNKQPARLTITVLPPWWKTLYAYLAYFVIFASAIYAVMRFLWARSLFRKESELYQTKLDFFTNVSHEIRTHLTLVGGPLQKAYQSPLIDTGTRNLLSYAKRNSDKLMNLVNELLEFRKMESGDVVLQVSEENLVRSLKIAHSAFEHLFKEKGIDAKLEFPSTGISVWYDAFQIQKVFYNLLSNACKFTPEGGVVEMLVEEDDMNVWVSVTDNGPGISSDHLEQIFDNFFQVYDQNTPNRGYGIGLALSRKIVEHHKGTLTVTSSQMQDGEAGKTCFKIQMLKGNAHFDESLITKTPMAVGVAEWPELMEQVPTGSRPKSSGKYTVLLIEDNDELRSFCKQVLENTYKIIEAADGQTGMEMAFELLPDLVVSDIMMPELNGLDLCAALKSDVRTCHIPVILLTARGATHQMIQGLKAGADAYVAKPFDVRALELKIKNLIHVRQILQHRNNPLVSVEPDGTVLNKLDKDFLAKLTALVEKNISNPDFGVKQMAEEVGMSLSLLYRKLRAITGLTVNDFVKSIRMKQAAQLLASRMHNVNEVAFMVGYDNRRHFSREFRKMYGHMPSMWAKR